MALSRPTLGPRLSRALPALALCLLFLGPSARAADSSPRTPAWEMRDPATLLELQREAAQIEGNRSIAEAAAAMYCQTLLPSAPRNPLEGPVGGAPWPSMDALDPSTLPEGEPRLCYYKLAAERAWHAASQATGAERDAAVAEALRFFEEGWEQAAPAVVISNFVKLGFALNFGSFLHEHVDKDRAWKLVAKAFNDKVRYMNDVSSDSNIATDILSWLLFDHVILWTVFLPYEDIPIQIS